MKQTNPIFKVYRKTGSSPDKSTWQYEMFVAHSWTEVDFPILDYRFDLYAMGGCGELTVSAGCDLKWTYNDRVDVDILGEKKYSGYVTTIPIDGTQDRFDYTVTGFVNQLEWSYIEDYNVKTIYIQDAIRDVVQTYVVPFTDIKYNSALLTMTLNDLNEYSDESWDGIIDNLEFSWATPAQILETLRQFLGQWDYGVDENQYLYFKKRSRDVVQRYFVGTGSTLSFLPSEDASSIKNVLHLDCGTVSNGDKYLRDYIDQDSIDDYGRREDRKTLESSFPLYQGYNCSADADITANGFDSADTHPERAIDGDIETYFDSIESQKAGAVLFSTLDGDAGDWPASTVGPDATIVGTPTFTVVGKWGGAEKAMTPGASDYVKWVNDDIGFAADQGAIEFWWKCPSDNPTQTIGFFTTLDDADAEGTPATTGGLTFDLYGRRLRMTARSEQSSAGQSTASPVMTWVSGQWYHIAAAWDSNGEDLAKLIGANQLRTSAFWIDGVLISYSRGKYTAPQGGKYVRFGYSTPTGATGDFSYLKLYDRPNAQWDMGQNDGNDSQYLELDLNEDRPIGQIIIRSSPGTASDIENEEYAKSLKVSSLPGYGGNSDWRTIFDGTNSQTDLAVTSLPDPSTRYIKIEITASDPNPWRIYEIDIREMWVGAINRWAEQWIIDNKDPEKSGVLTLAEVSDIPGIGERVAVHDRNGKVYDYITTHVSYESSANTAQVELGEREGYIVPVLRQIYRKMIEMDHTETSDISQTSSGYGYVPQSIPTSAVGSVSGDQVLSGVIKSRNYIVGTSGMSINLESAVFKIYEPEGIEIYSAGGVTITGGGSIIAGDVELDSDGVITVGTGDDVAVMSADDGTYRFWAGDAVGADAPFNVTKAGILSATGATISGTITATSGAIGGFTIGATTLASGTNIILDAGNKRISMNSATFGNEGIQIEYNGGKPRMYIGDGANSFFKFEWTSLVNATYKWTASGSGTNEYYCELSGGGDPSLNQPASVFINGANATKAEIGSLAAGNWGYGDNDTLGYPTVYVRLSDGTDPDSKADDYVNMNETLIGAAQVTVNGAAWLSVKGHRNIFVGEGSGNSITTAYRCATLGYWTGRDLTSGSDNVFIGALCGDDVTTGSSNSLIGYIAGGGITTGDYNVCVGAGSGGIDDYTSNTIVGYLSGGGSGSNNVTLGREAGKSISGSDTICIGSYSGFYETGSDKLFIDNRTRTNEADGRIKALIYGVMADTTAAQELHFNCKTFMLEEAKFGGGYGSTGVTISAAGAIQANSNLTIDGYGSFGGGYGGGSGVSCGSTGIISANGYIIADSYINAVGGFKDNGTAGVDGTFEDNNGNTVTVSGGIITNLTT